MKHSVVSIGVAGTLLTVALFAMGTARADVILYDNFGPGTSFNTSSGWTVGIGFTPADAFTVPGSTNYTLSSISLAVGFGSGPINGITVNLETSVGGQPGSILETWSVTNLPPFGNSPLEVLNSVVHPLLIGGDQYWIVLSGDPNSTSSWNKNSIGFTGPHAISLDDGPFTISTATTGAFSVTAAPVANLPTDPISVPEPASFTLFSLAVLGACAYYGARRRQTATGTHDKPFSKT